MKVCAVICEYNPFHNGHKYQLDWIKKEYDGVVCIMSGAFVQRGEPAVFDKWTRANAAVLNGVDLVVELPVCYAVNTAERFAFGAVSIADKMKIIDALCFGSESGDESELKNAAKLLYNEPFEVSENIKRLMKTGVNFPTARELAFAELIDISLLKEPNNILALEYIKALIALKSTIKPVALKRKDSSYHETVPSSNITSATAIRNLIYTNGNFENYVPQNCCELYEKITPSNIDELDNILLYLLKTTSPEELSKISDVSEGLENRLIDAANNCNSFDELCSFIKSKRYTYTKISRILMSIILKLDKELSKAEPEYLRVLAMNKIGMELLNKIKEKSELTIITKPADFKGFNKSFDLDILSGDIYSLCAKDSPKNPRDFLNSPVIIKN